VTNLALKRSAFENGATHPHRISRTTLGNTYDVPIIIPFNSENNPEQNVLNKK